MLTDDMTGQLDLFDDDSLPVESTTYQQTAVVFTAIGGKDAGKLAYSLHPDPEWFREYIASRQRMHGRPVDARVMTRTITCGEWRPL